MFVQNRQFNHEKLFEVIYVMTKNLNRVIDINYYPVERQLQSQESTRSNSVDNWLRADCVLCSYVLCMLSNMDTYNHLSEARYSNLKNRPIGIGCQGLADAFILCRLPFESDEARQLNKEIFETMGQIT